MKGFLIDTNIPSELTRPRPEQRVVNFLERVAREQVYFSVLSLGEICKGIAGHPEAGRRKELQTFLDDEIRPWLGNRILPVTAAIAERWGALCGESKLRGRTLPVVDSLLAATALEHDLIIVTRNTENFAGLGATILNPWEETAP